MNENVELQPQLTEQECKAIIDNALNDHRYFIETFISIKDKDRHIIPFIFNPIQDIFYKKYIDLNVRGIRNHIILKPRQLGFTTLVCALFLTECILVPNTTAVIIAHDAESTARIFEITKLMYEKLPDEVRPATRFSSKRELVFEALNSKIFIGTAGSTKFGRGTTINLLHASEYAFWENPEEILTALLETVPMGGIVIYETTANGFNHFYDQYTEAKDADERARKLNNIPFPHFFRWFDHPEYRHDLDSSELDYIKETLTDEEKQLMKVHALTLDRISWRRSKKQTQKAKFFQEYPEDDSTCFVSSGRPFFNHQVLKSIILWNEENKTWDKEDSEGAIIERGWTKKELEYITIFKNFKPDGSIYVACVDPAEGNPTSTFSSALILRLNKDPVFIEQCAEICAKIPMPKFYKLTYHMASLYRFPRIAIERNNHGHLLNWWATNGYMQDQTKILDKYPNVYIAKDGKAGWVTTQATRPLMLDNFAELVTNNMVVIYSKNTLNQALTFVYNANGRPEPDKNKNGDNVIAISIGSFILIHEKQKPGFSFLNKESFGIRDNTPQKAYVSEEKRLIYDDERKHPLDHNVTVSAPFVGEPEIVDWKKYIG
jgi:hypothetical protein